MCRINTAIQQSKMMRSMARLERPSHRRRTERSFKTRSMRSIFSRRMKRSRRMILAACTQECMHARMPSVVRAASALLRRLHQPYCFRCSALSSCALVSAAVIPVATERHELLLKKSSAYSMHAVV